MAKRKKTTARGLGDDPLKWIKEDTAATATSELPAPSPQPQVAPSAPVLPAIESSEPIVLDAVLTIAEAAALKDRLLPHLNRKGEICVDASRIAAVDTAGLQVLLAFVRTVQGHGAVVQWSGVSDALLNTALLLGVAGQIGFPS